MTRAEKLQRCAPYRSLLEVDIAQDLEERDVPFEYEDTVLTYEEPAHIRRYTPDFRLPNGIIVEAKGIWSASDRKKMTLVMEQHPELDIRMLFERNQKLSKKSRTRYADWCKKRNIKYAIGRTVPQEWLDEEGS